MSMKINDELLYQLPHEDLTDEEIKALLDLGEAYNKIFVLCLRRQLGLDIIYLDSNHVIVEGEIVEISDFLEWLEEHLDELESTNENISSDGKIYQA